MTQMIWPIVDTPRLFRIIPSEAPLKDYALALPSRLDVNYLQRDFQTSCALHFFYATLRPQSFQILMHKLANIDAADRASPAFGFRLRRCDSVIHVEYTLPD